MTFKESVLRIVKDIPEGRTRTYKEVATLAGNPNGARAVGAVMRANQDLSVPCHRVIKSNGQAGGYNGLRGKTKAELLKEESAI